MDKKNYNMDKKNYNMDKMPGRISLLVDKFEGGNASVFAKKAGISQSTFHNYMSGKREPSYKKLLLICDSYNVNIDWLMANNGNMMKNNRHIEESPQKNNTHPQASDPATCVLLKELINIVNDKDWMMTWLSSFTGLLRNKSRVAPEMLLELKEVIEEKMEMQTPHAKVTKIMELPEPKTEEAKKNDYPLQKKSIIG